MHYWKVIFVLLAGCGAAKEPCDGIPCSDGRVCVVRSVDKVACEVPDAGP